MLIIGIVAILEGVAKLALWGVVLAFGIWAHRRFKLRSLPWLGIYLILSAVLALLAYGMPMRSVVDAMISQGAPFGWTLGQFVATWNYLGSLVGNLAKLVLCILILSDIAFLLSKIGVEIKGKFLIRLLAAREVSIYLGIAMIGIRLIAPAIDLTLYFRYV